MVNADVEPTKQWLPSGLGGWIAGNAKMGTNAVLIAHQ
jgi:hypothetical protein